MEIVDNTIYITRGNSLEIELTITNDEETYIFQEGDYVTFAIYPKKGLNSSPIVYKKVDAEPSTNKTIITLSDQEMKFGEMANKPIEYWYEITLNGETVVGYDENGAKQLILYPEGQDQQ